MTLQTGILYDFYSLKWEHLSESTITWWYGDIQMQWDILNSIQVTEQTVTWMEVSLGPPVLDSLLT